MVSQVDMGGAARYFMLQTIREYAQKRLEEAGQGAEARARNATYYLGVAEWQTLASLEIERGNIGAARRWLLDHHDYDAATRMSSALGLPWYTTGSLSETVRWTEEVRDDPSSSRLTRARALYLLGAMQHMQGRHAEAVRSLEASQQLFRELGDRAGTADTLAFLGQTALFQRHYEHAAALLEESLPVHRELGDELGTAFVLSYLALARRAQGDSRRAEMLSDEAMDVIYRSVDRVGVSVALFALTVAALGRGDLRHARRLVGDGLRNSFDHREWSNMGSWLQMLAVFAAAEDDPRRQATLLGAAETLQTSGDHPYVPGFAYLGELVALAGQPLPARRTALDPDSWTQALHEGRSMTPQRILDVALEPDGRA